MLISNVKASDKDIIDSFIRDAKDDLIQGQITKGIKASGKSAKLLTTRVESQEGIFTRGMLVDGSGYFPYQEFGRGPGKVPYGFSKIIYDWLQYQKYGLHYNSDAQRWFIAYRISQKIARQGTLTYRTNRRTNLISDVLKQQRLDALKEVFASKMKTELLTDIRGIFK